MTEPELIGGHAGLQVWRTDQGILKVVLDFPNHAANLAGIRNEARMLRLMEGSGFAPHLLSETSIGLLQEDVGMTLEQASVAGQVLIQNGERFRRNCAGLLMTLRDRRIRHGDLTAPNIAVREGDVPIVLDWQQSHLFDEPHLDKHYSSDSWLLWRRVAGFPAVEPPTADAPRVVRRWLAVMADLGGSVGVENLKGKTLLDLGCFQGDFCGLAAADGMEATGVDLGGFDPAVDSILAGRDIWAPRTGRVNLVRADITQLANYSADAVLLFSVWPYVLRDHGRDAADCLVADCVNQADRLYFEVQLYGDGPGPEFFRWDDDVHNYLAAFGNPVALATLPVTGRDATRTVWRVTRHGR